MDGVTLLDLRTRALELSNTVNDTNVTVAQLNALANRHLKAVTNLLVDAGPADYYASTTQITTTSGIVENALPADFRNLVAVYVRETADRRRPIDPMREAARGNYKAPTGVWTLDVEYIPTAPFLEEDGDTFDAISGWDELVVNLMARDIMVKRESDPSVVLNTIAEEKARIRSESRKRDRRPKRITDLDDRESNAWPYIDTSGSRIACYRLRAGNLELYEPLWGYPT